jgi:N-acetyl-D-muramate 6-phosphate phosphatase
MKPTAPYAALLFDLDGTLLDTAPDLAWALNTLLQEHQLPPLEYASIRTQVSNGATAVLRLGFPTADAARFDELRPRFLQIYRDNLTRATRLFPGFETVLAQLEAHHIPWGIITNKPAAFTEPLLQQLGLYQRASCVLSGDSLPVQKPHPLPLLTAAQRLGVEPTRCIYVGDALRDAQAARSANMVAIGARFGYIDAAEDLNAWPVDAWIEQPLDLLEWVGLGQGPGSPDSPVAEA